MRRRALCTLLLLGALCSVLTLAPLPAASAETITVTTPAQYVNIVVLRRAGFDPKACGYDGNLAAPPTLTSADFTCFLTRFVEGDLYADCDGSGRRPYLNIADFTCFVQSFAHGRRDPITVQVGTPLWLPEIPWYECRCNGACVSGCLDWARAWWADPDYWALQFAPVNGVVTFTTAFPCITVEVTDGGALRTVMHGAPGN